MQHSLWPPAATLPAQRARAALNAEIRRFFAARQVLEVEVPLLAAAAPTDPHIDSLRVPTGAGDRYLQSSPEFAMKRLLAAGSGPIYSLAKAFRRGEAGRRHNPEFTMLEWYRPGYDEQTLMDEVTALLQAVVDVEPVCRLSYREVFQRHLEIDPHTASESELRQLAQPYIGADWPGADRDTWLDLLISHAVEPQLGPGLTFIYDYPVSQAALARLGNDSQGQPVAKRFEAYLGGMELANGYWELIDVAEQRRRFAADLRRRRALKLPCPRSDRRLLAALAAGMPDCAGVALGVDRLLMQVMGADHIDTVVAFPWDRA
ncbi:EF-P lysine aminoacylase GenX [Exilibacterium tricleocarpae]|uniref:EF-P lysine aminoacylase GenX n=1 Tax=Exilibacterium tricleocarpae TaxID=2591008 RepID=A0A545T3P5_9GAMM|nr:EF-P lysine aminoacylase EpmA [Exilibacterium tricleocarpae]TQV71839.1 EF-P lysine aminoacylase GenX [Exilibacterium tricleocarpae]